MRRIKIRSDLVFLPQQAGSRRATADKKSATDWTKVAKIGQQIVWEADLSDNSETYKKAGSGISGTLSATLQKVGCDHKVSAL